jgi:hypothetical protein
MWFGYKATGRGLERQAERVHKVEEGVCIIVVMHVIDIIPRVQLFFNSFGSF